MSLEALLRRLSGPNKLATVIKSCNVYKTYQKTATSWNDSIMAGSLMLILQDLAKGC